MPKRKLRLQTPVMLVGREAATINVSNNRGEVRTMGTSELLEMGKRLERVFEGLDEHVVKTVKEETSEFLTARDRFGDEGMEMGRRLYNVRTILEPLKRWKMWVRAIPAMSISTSYRLINTWKNAQKVMTPALVKVVLASGKRVISQETDGGWLGQFDDAAKLVQKKLGPPPDDELKAQEWLDELVKEKRVLARESRKSNEVDIGKLAVSLLNKFERDIDKVPEDQKRSFALQVIGTLMTAAKHLADAPVTKMRPVEVPQLTQAQAA